jgi:cytosine/adenosine deaminase-related metal-dependent hydrolase
LNDVGLLAQDVVLAHCVHVNEKELTILEKTGSKVAHSPISNMLNAVGVAPVPKMLSMGIPIGLGDDGYTFDGFENIRALPLLHKIASHDPYIIRPIEILKMATIEGAKLYGVQNELGSIEAGKLADIIILNPALSQTIAYPENVVEYLTGIANGTDVETVIVGGKIVMHERRVLTLDEASVMKRARKSTEKLWSKLGLRR